MQRRESRLSREKYVVAETIQGELREDVIDWMVWNYIMMLSFDERDMAMETEEQRSLILYRNRH